MTVSPFDLPAAPDALSLRRALEAARDAMLRTASDEETRNWCRWVTQRFVEASRVLAGDEEHFGKRYPAQEAALAQAQRLAREPIAHLGKLLPFLKSFGRWLVRELERQQQTLSSANAPAIASASAAVSSSAGTLPRWRKLRTPRASRPDSDNASVSHAPDDTPADHLSP